MSKRFFGIFISIYIYFFRKGGMDDWPERGGGGGGTRQSVPTTQQPVRAAQLSGGAPDPQCECPLFAKLPGEIREKIYGFALGSSDDRSRPFDRQHHHYRPGHEYRQRHDFRLLETCKRVYLEARLLPVRVNEIVVYLFRGPRSNPPSPLQHDWRLRCRRMTPDQRGAVTRVHFFVQQWYLEVTVDLLVPNRVFYLFEEPARCGDDVLTAREIVLTFRRSDWWSWESPVMSNDQLGICPWRHGRTDWRQMEAEPLEGPPQGRWDGWGAQFQYVTRLEMLQIEFETVLAKKRQLERVVERAKHWRFPLKNDKVLAWTGDVKQSTWEGSVTLKEDYGDRPVQLRSVRDDAVDAKPKTCTYVVMVMRWRVTRREQI